MSAITRHSVMSDRSTACFATALRRTCRGFHPWHIVPLVLVAAVAGCRVDGVSNGPTVTGSGNVVEQKHDVDGCRSLSISVPGRVTIRTGDRSELVVRADDNIMKYIEVTRDEEKVSVSFKESVRLRKATLAIEATIPDLERLHVRGAVELAFEQYRTESLAIDVEGAANVTGELDVDRLVLEPRGAAHVALTAPRDVTADDIDVRAQGAVKIELQGLPGQRVRASIEGLGACDVRAIESLDITARGACRVTYHGKPKKLHVDAKGLSQVNAAE